MRYNIFTYIINNTTGPGTMRFIGRLLLDINLYIMNYDTTKEM